MTPSAHGPASPHDSAALVLDDSDNGMPLSTLPLASNSSGPPSVLYRSPTLPGMLVALRRRLVLALVLGVVCSVPVAVGVWYGLPSSFSARTLLHVAAIRPKILFDTTEVRPDFASFQRTQITMVKSRLVLRSALRDPRVADVAVVREAKDPVDWLEKHIVADYLIAPEIMRIALSGDNPDELTLLVEAVRDAYLTEIVNKEQNQHMARLEQLKKLSADYDETLRTKRNTLREMAEKMGSRNSQTLSIKQQFALGQLNALQSEYYQLQSMLRKSQLEVAALQIKGEPASDRIAAEALIEDSFKKDPIVSRLSQEIMRYQEDAEWIKDRAREPEKDPTFRHTMKAMDIAKKALTARQLQLRPAALAQLGDHERSKFKSTLAGHQVQVEILTKEEKILAEEVKRRGQDLYALTKGTVDLEWLREEIAQAEDVHKKVGSELQALQVELQAPQRVTLLEEVVVSHSKRGSRQLAVVSLAFLGTFSLIAFAIAWREFSNRRVAGIEDVVYGLGMNLVGTLPNMSARARRSLVGAMPPAASDLPLQNMYNESVDATRTLLLHAAQSTPLHTVLVTSASGSEGKTFLSFNLAVSLARSGFRTLLLDADLRHPSQHLLLNMEKGPGFNELLRGEVEIADVVQPGPVPDLSIITAGACDQDSIRALNFKTLPGILGRLKERFDFVVVDAAPILPVVDSLLISKHVDGVLFSILRNVSRLPSVYAACQRLANLNVRILGAVVNATPPDSYDSPYYMSAPASARASSDAAVTT